jgi:PAS domain S-box-containing protein
LRFARPLVLQSLAGRVFALYAANLLLFVLAGAAYFYHYQFNRELDDAQESAQLLGTVVAQTISDSVVIGDYDTIRRMLDRTVRGSMLGSALFIDVAGSSIAAASPQASGNAPAWLTDRVAARLLDINNVIAVGGHDYGVLRLRFAPDRVAAEIWEVTLRVLLISAAVLALGLFLINLSLRRWLGGLDSIRRFDWGGPHGAASREVARSGDFPVEIQEAVDSFRRAGAALQTQRETAAVTLNAIADGVISTDERGRILYANPAAQEMLGRDLASMLRQDLRRAVPDAFSDAAAGGPLGAWSGRCITHAQGQEGVRALDTTLSPILEPGGRTIGHVLALRDVTEAQRYENRLRDELRTRQDALKALRGAVAGLLPQADLAGLGAPDGDLGAVSQLVADLVREREASRRELVNQMFALDQHAAVSVANSRGDITYVNDKFVKLSGFSAAELLESNHRIFASGLHPPEFYRGMWETISAGRVWHGDIANRRPDGSLYWVATTIVPWLDQDGIPARYIAIRTDISRQKEIEFALEEARRRELATGHAIQRAMLIGEPPRHMRAAQAASFTDPSQGIDGDFFAFTTLRPDCLELLVGDVMGKGVPAALVGAAVRTAYNQVVTEELAASLGSGDLPLPERIVNALHETLTPRLLDVEVFVTLALYRFDFSSGSLRYVNAGHTEGLVLRGDGGVERILGENVPVGVTTGERYVGTTVPFGAGDALVVYSDGITEARDRNQESFGEERLSRILASAFGQGLPPSICLQVLRGAVREFVGGADMADDQTAVMVNIPREDPGGGPPPDVIDLPWNAGGLGQLRARVADAAAALGTEAADALVLATFEAATNVVRHVPQPFPEAGFTCRIVRGAGAVSVEVWHLGEPFQPPDELAPDFSGATEGGFGLYIMRNAVSEVTHESPFPGVCRIRLTQSEARQAVPAA